MFGEEWFSNIARDFSGLKILKSRKARQKLETL